MNIQIETITLADGIKVEAIRDIEKVRLVVDVAHKMAESLRDGGHTGVNNRCTSCAALREWEALSS